MARMKEGSQGRQVRGKERGMLNSGTDATGYITGPTNLDSEKRGPGTGHVGKNEMVTGGAKKSFPKKAPTKRGSHK